MAYFERIPLRRPGRQRPHPEVQCLFEMASVLQFSRVTYWQTVGVKVNVGTLEGPGPDLLFLSRTWYLCSRGSHTPIMNENTLLIQQIFIKHLTSDFLTFWLQKASSETYM